MISVGRAVLLFLLSFVMGCDTLRNMSCTRHSLKTSSRRIIGGGPVPDNEYPWMAFFHKINGRNLVCGMELIAPRWLMTACHCILNPGNTGYEPAGAPGRSQAKFNC